MAKDRFGFLLDALRYGAPPHGGIALGIDRVVMLFGGLDNIRDCIAFPKTQRAMDLMTEAPGDVENKQMKELHIQIETPPVKKIISAAPFIRLALHELELWQCPALHRNTQRGQYQGMGSLERQRPKRVHAFALS